MKPKLLVARAIFPEVLERLAQHFELVTNQDDESWSPAQLKIRRGSCWPGRVVACGSGTSQTRCSSPAVWAARHDCANGNSCG